MEKISDVSQPIEENQKAISYIRCIYKIKDNKVKYLNIKVLNFDETSITFLSNYITDTEMQNTSYIQSVIKSKDSKAFFCGVLVTGESYCLIYDYNDFIYDDENGNPVIDYDKENGKKCKVASYNVKTYYFPETDQYVFSCLTEDNGIQTTFYKKI